MKSLSESEKNKVEGHITRGTAALISGVKSGKGRSDRTPDLAIKILNEFIGRFQDYHMLCDEEIKFINEWVVPSLESCKIEIKGL